MLKLLRRLGLATVLVGTLFLAAPPAADAARATVATELVQPVQYYGYGYRRGYYHRRFYGGYYGRPYYGRPFYHRYYGRPYYYRRY